MHYAAAMTTGKLDYYASRSGLTVGTLDDHMFAFYSDLSGLTAGSLNDHMLAYFKAQNADSTHDLKYQTYKFYDTQTGGLGGSMTDVQARFFGNPPADPGGGGSGFGVSGFGTGGFGL